MTTYVDPPRPTTASEPLIDASIETGTEQLLAAIEDAAQWIGVARPLDRFVGMNPLAGLEHLPFADAIRVAGDRLGARGTLSEAVYRSQFAAGRIGSGDLARAVEIELGDEAGATILLPTGEVRAVDVIVDDLLHGPAEAPPIRRHRTLAEVHAPALAGQIDRRTARWCAAYADAGQSSWQMPERERGLYGAWRAIGVHEPGCPRVLRDALRVAPADAATAAAAALHRLGVPPDEVSSTVEAHLTAMPGWAGHLRWLGMRGGRADLVDLLAVRLVQEAALLGDGAWMPSRVAPLLRERAATARERGARLLGRWGIPTADGAALQAVTAALAAVDGRRELIWLTAYEAGYRTQLLRQLNRPAPRVPAAPVAQIVCCIDPRSEGLRRHIEAIGHYDTIGFAGFFGISLAVQELGSVSLVAHCPVPLPPQHDAVEQLRMPVAEGRRALAGQRVLHALTQAEHSARDGALAPFTLAEAAGAAAAPMLVGRTLAPATFARLRGWMRGVIAPDPVTQLRPNAELAVPERVELAESMLRTMGLVDGFAPLLVLCGHESRTENNPYAAALDCGACGGHSGAPNARYAAALLNEPAVRDGLRGRGIDVPASTWVVAALHETTTDTVRLLDVDLSPLAQRAALARLSADLERAGHALCDERLASLPGARAAGGRVRRSAASRSADWAQPFPEWGLAGNAALIIGPRAMTRGLDLGRRTFLHSYDPGLDPTGSVLEAILTAPLVVAHGLSAQYYASTVDPVRLGSGTKAIHNVVGGIGVLAAAGGDLLTGLPWQSVADGERLIHEPMRLLVLVDAPTERIDEVLERHPQVSQLVDGAWIHLLARDASADGWRQRTVDGWTHIASPQPALGQTGIPADTTVTGTPSINPGA